MSILDKDPNCTAGWPWVLVNCIQETIMRLAIDRPERLNDEHYHWTLKEIDPDLAFLHLLTGIHLTADMKFDIYEHGLHLNLLTAAQRHWKVPPKPQQTFNRPLPKLKEWEIHLMNRIREGNLAGFTKTWRAILEGCEITGWLFTSTFILELTRAASDPNTPFNFDNDVPGLKNCLTLLQIAISQPWKLGSYLCDCSNFIPPICWACIISLSQSPFQLRLERHYPRMLKSQVWQARKHPRYAQYFPDLEDRRRSAEGKSVQPVRVTRTRGPAGHDYDFLNGDTLEEKSKISKKLTRQHRNSRFLRTLNSFIF
jgi:hypothetical protein